ncbi:hypothetical protein [Antarcticirhabdus aurantiaca]|uniref:Uncharacterized protein n=1 Tax=Antarcticirhabdus aurantiaca TaxID=2606717 RepID=A0ACD4NM63_9HYPH|nr:hypothetical protein OXU80_23880 [Jeongeuplla avenae]
MTIHSISNGRVRNLLRGLVVADNTNAARQTLANLRKSARPAELYEVFAYIRSDAKLRRTLLVDDFPKSARAYLDIMDVPSEGTSKELAVIMPAVLEQQEALTRFINSVGALDRAIFNGSASDVYDAIRKAMPTYGFSLVLLKRLISAKYLFQHDDAIQSQIQVYLQNYNFNKRDIVAVAIEDAIDPHRGYSNVRRAFIKFIAGGRLRFPASEVIADFFEPDADSPDIFARRLQAFSVFSLPDAVYYLLSSNIVQEDGCLAELPSSVRMPGQVLDAWKDAHSDFESHRFLHSSEDEDKFAELTFLRHTSSWIDYPSVRRYRKWIESAVGHRFSARKRQSHLAAYDNPFAAARDIAALANNPVQTPLNIENIDASLGGCLHRTIALMLMIERESQSCALDGIGLLQLLDKTVDVALLTTANELSTFLGSKSYDDLFEYLRAALLFDSTETERHAHALRKATQRVVLSRFNGDITQFLDFLQSSGSHVGAHFFHTANEQFLVRLYDLYPTAADVTNARVSMLEWYSQVTDDPPMHDHANVLRLESKLRQVRGDLDENRIYVDSARYLQWLSEQVLSELRDLVPILAGWHQEITATTEFRSEIARLQDPHARLVFIIDRAYREFCANKFYGVDSYIGRRIRHGTLHGVMVTDVRRMAEELIGFCQLNDHSFSQYVAQWLKTYENIVEDLGENIFRIRSDEKPRGAIDPTIVSPDKTASTNLALKTIQTSLQQEGGLRVAQGAILEFCWIILETDLERIRNDLRTLRQNLILDISAEGSSSIEGRQKIVVDAIRDINDLVNRKFQSLINWFSRPPNVSPSATLSLLFQAVFKEVSESFAHKRAISVELGETGINLFGHRYHYIYDILYVLVHNAVKYGRDDGRVSFEVTNESKGGSTASLVLSVQSECDGDSSLDHARTRISEAMTADIEGALVQVGFTGIRKVRTLVASVDEIQELTVAFAGRCVRFEVALNIKT